MKRRLFLALLATTAWRAPAVSAADPIPVVASFSLLADLVRRVGGERVAVTSLIGPNADAHGFEPSPSDAGRVARARLVVVNGLGLEGWIDRLVKAAGAKAPTLVVASRGVRPITEAGHGHGHDTDPHAFQDVGNAKRYVATIRDALIAADPSGRDVYSANATAYLGELDTLDAEIRAGLARIPAARRRVITSHDAFAYFSAAYGVAFIAPRGVSAESDVSARDVARIVRQIKAEKIPALFLENVADPRLMEQIARDSGARIGGKLYSDALSEPDGPAPTYLGLMRSNLRTLTSALVE